MMMMLRNCDDAHDYAGDVDGDDGVGFEIDVHDGCCYCDVNVFHL